MRGYWNQVRCGDGAGLLVASGFGMHDFVGNTERGRFGDSGDFRAWPNQDLFRYRSVYAAEQIGLKAEGENEEERELEEGEILDEISRQEAVGEEPQAMEMDSLSLYRTKYSLDLSNGDLGSSKSLLKTPTLVTDCCNGESLDAYSAYQNKFRNYERLPSPTPEDRCGKDDEALSVALGYLNAVKYSAPTAVSCGIMPARSAPLRSCVPRSHYAELNQPQNVVTNMVSVEAPSGKAAEFKSKLNVCFDGSNQDCPASKRQRSGLLDTNNRREIDSSMGIQLKPRDPRRAFLQSMTLSDRCSQKVDSNKKVNDQILEGYKTDACSTSEDSMEGASKSRATWSDVKHLFDGYDDHQIAKILEERERRLEEQKKLFAERKICLVLDLDHTLLNSAKFCEIDQVHEETLRWVEKQEREKPYRHLFRLPGMAMWTKLRPGIWNFLEKASKLCELHLCTMGNKLYASEMAKILDPKGVLFAGRVISKGDEGDFIDGNDRVSKTKDLEGVLGMESSVIILDDCKSVWPHHRPNLIAVERYIYFPCSRRQFGLAGPSLLDIGRDERPEDGALASVLAVIERLHEAFFSHSDLDSADVRVIFADEQRKILSGCRIVFSHVFPVAEVNPHLHPLWKLAEQLGASCTNQIGEEVTHVVANSPGTDKVKWALSTGRFVVRPNWLEASALLYRRALEQDFAFKTAILREVASVPKGD